MEDINKLKIKNILLIDLAFIGDVVLVGPVLRALHKKWPTARISMLTVPLTAPVARMLPYVQEVIVYDKAGEDKGLLGMWHMAQRLEKKHFDLALCMNFALRGAAVAKMAKIPYRLGYNAQHASWLLTWAASPVRDGIKHERQNHLEIFKPVGIEADRLDLSLVPPVEAVASFWEKAKKLKMSSKGYFILCPQGSYERKDFSIATASEICQRLDKEKMVFLIGGPKEKLFLKAVARAAHLPEERVLAGSFNLQELAVCLKESKALISVDTGPMHIAQAVGCPTVAVFGPTDPRIWGTVNENSISLYHGEECSPCWGKGKCKYNTCMKKIKTDMILEAVNKIIEEE